MIAKLKPFHSLWFGVVMLTPVVMLAANWMAMVGVACGVLAAVALARPQGVIAACQDRRDLWLPGALMGFLALWAVISLFWALPESEAKNKITGTAVLFLSVTPVLAVALMITRAERTRLAKALGVAVAISCLLALDYRFGHVVHDAIRGALGLESHWRTAGANRALNVLAIVGWTAVYALGKYYRLWPAVALAALLILVLASGPSLASTLAAFFGIGGFLFGLAGGKFAPRAVGAALAALTMIFPLLPGNLLSPERHFEWLRNVSTSGLHRLYIWQFTAENIQKHPFIGFGFDASRALPGGKEIAAENWAKMPLHPHNAALQVWLELGLPGALVLAGLFLAAGFAIARIEERLARAVCLASLLAACAPLMASFGVWQSWWLGSLTMCAAAAVAFLHTQAPGKA